MCEYRTPPISTNCCVSPDVDTAAFVKRSRCVRPISPAGDLEAPNPISTSHPRFPGGASPATISPDTDTRHLAYPRDFNASTACCAAYPFAIPPRSSLIPFCLSRTVCLLGSSSIFSHPTNPRASDNSASLGSPPLRRVARHCLTIGPTVTSNAPLLARDISHAFDRTTYKSSLTCIGGPPACSHNRINSLCGR